MKDVPRVAFTLALVSLLAAGSLAWVNEFIKTRTAQHFEPEFKSALAFVLSGSETGHIVLVRENRKILYYIGYRDKDHHVVAGYAFLTESTGYASTIRTLVGIDSTGRILSMKIISEQETPGLGTRCEEIRPGETSPWWQVQFCNKQATALAVDKDGGDIQALTGATITSRAITDSIVSRAGFVLSRLRSEKP